MISKQITRLGEHTSMKAWAFASDATRSISSCDGSISVPSNPYIMFRFTDLAKRVGS